LDKPTPDSFKTRAVRLGEKLEAARKRGAIVGASDMVSLLPDVMRLLADMAHELDRFRFTANELTHLDEDDDR